MFERFTDRARRVVVLAQEEARLLNHNYIGTEHLLLGLIHEGQGVAAKALESLGISLEAVRAQVEEIIGQGQQAPTGHIPFTRGRRRSWSCRCGRPSSSATTTSVPSTSCSG
jgi:ATP-dependent Clp protease ATP-binding subunit ClpC